MKRASDQFPLPARKESGVVLLISLILLIALTLGGIALIRQVTMGVLIAGNLTFKNAALAASDFGVEAARNWLVNSGADLQQASVVNGYFAASCNSVIDASGRPDADGNGEVDDCGATPVPQPEFNPLNYNWANSVLVTANDGNGNSIRYVIHRLCRLPGGTSETITLTVGGTPTNIAQECVTLGSTGAGSSKGSIGYGATPLKNTVQPYFRITTQSSGPNNTIAYSQAIIY